ncbi:MAG: triphosphoribosyl-dephospho-CoA synthase [Isosphaeraceae bacterium]|jgi:triphosphoribosyl-dephospho-CoA synthase|nr:MAG: triphosphoribosyl-dephospho-CoA synthase [Isosphaeraceae bacterium]
MNGPPIPTLVRIACLLEAAARKPGNVHPEASFDDCCFLDFCLSAAALGDQLDPSRIAARGVGATILDAVQATRCVTRANTNLGIVLLLTPLAAVPPETPLRPGIDQVLDSLTIADAQAVYRAIRLVHPGGLGTTGEQDVSHEPTVTLRDAMRLAAGRDAVAAQYANGFAEIFDVGLPTLAAHLEAGDPLETSIVATHLVLMATTPDTLIARKSGPQVAHESARRARAVLDAGWPDTEAGRIAFHELDRWLRGDGHARNPGTTADLVAATLFAALREQRIHLPIDGCTAFPPDSPARTPP